MTNIIKEVAFHHACLLPVQFSALNNFVVDSVPSFFTKLLGKKGNHPG
jgi:hypothetical protein